MLLIDAVATADGDQIKVPRYHRGHLSFRTNTEVTVCLLPPNLHSTVPGMNELVVSASLFDAWQDAIRITALFRDKPGVVRKLVDAIRRHDINIMYEESATIENGRYHRVEVLAIVRSQSHPRLGELNPVEFLPALERRLKAICLDELEITAGIPRLKVRPMEGLRNAWHSTIEHRQVARRMFGSFPFPERTTIREGVLRIPNSILGELNTPNPRYVLVSDTRDRLLRILLPGQGTAFTYVSVAHRDRIGSLFLISDALARAFTAVLTLTRLKHQGSQNDVEFLLYSRDLPREDQEAQRRALISHLLASLEVNHDLSIKLSYPRRAGEIAREAIPPELSTMPVPSIEETAEIESDLYHLPTKGILGAKMQSYTESLRTRPDQHIRARLDAARHLASEEGLYPLPDPRVFISYNFDRSDLYRVVAEHILKSKGSNIVASGQNPVGQGGPYRFEIRDRIKASQGFIAIWGANADLRWLLPELGVALAFGIPILILPHQDLKDSPHRDIFPEIHYEKFADETLAEVFAKSWSAFRVQMADYHRMSVLRHTP